MEWLVPCEAIQRRSRSQNTPQRRVLARHMLP